MSQYYVQPVDQSLSPNWILFESGKFQTPLRIIPDAEIFDVLVQYLKIHPDRQVLARVKEQVEGKL